MRVLQSGLDEDGRDPFARALAAANAKSGGSSLLANMVLGNRRHGTYRSWKPAPGWPTPAELAAQLRWSACCSSLMTSASATQGS